MFTCTVEVCASSQEAAGDARWLQRREWAAEPWIPHCAGHTSQSCKFIFLGDPERDGPGSWVISNSSSSFRFMVKLAEETDGIIVTNEQIHTLMNNSKKLMVKDR